MIKYQRVVQYSVLSQIHVIINVCLFVDNGLNVVSMVYY